MRVAVVILLLTLWMSGSLAGQSNPFDLVPRLSAVGPQDTVTYEESGNPFDIVAPDEEAAAAAPVLPEAAPAPAPQREAVVTIDSSFRRIMFISLIVSLLLLTVLVTLFRGQLSRAYRAFINDTMMNQLQRERESGGGIPYYLFYFYFMLNAGFFLFLLARQNGVGYSSGPLTALLYTIAGVAAFFLLKHLLLSIIGGIFPVAKEVRLYNLTIVVFNVIVGLLLTPVNLLFAFGSEALQPIVLYGTLTGLAAVYGFLLLRGLFLASRFLYFHKFHFLLYICTVEIAPVLILIKLIANGL